MIVEVKQEADNRKRGSQQDVRYQESAVTLDCILWRKNTVKGHLFFYCQKKKRLLSILSGTENLAEKG